MRFHPPLGRTILVAQSMFIEVQMKYNLLTNQLFSWLGLSILPLLRINYHTHMYDVLIKILLLQIDVIIQ